MKNIILLSFLLASLTAFAQNSIDLTINHKVGTDNLEFNTEFTIPNGDKVQLNRCEYYISQITLTHDGGQTTSIEDIWILVDAFDPSVYDLGEYNVEQLESITLWIGVETPENNDDPTSWPASHPLAPQNPSMHWGWTAGYRFLAMEGTSGTNSADYDFQIHALGNENYHEQVVAVAESAENGELHVVINADYTQAFTNVTTAAGGITHGASGDSVDMLNNFRDAVFTAGLSVGIEENELNELSIQIAPNPTVNGENAKLLLEFSNSNNYDLEIVDITGKIVFSELVSGANSSIDLPLLRAGVYLINLKSEDGLTAAQRWVIK